jgi:Domain of unknown function DUF29
MQSKAQIATSSLYDTDYQLWIDQTVTQLKARELSQIDWENLIEEIESLGKSDKRAIVSDLIRLCEHLLKLQHWGSERETCFKGWVQEINNFRSEIELILEDSPSLKLFLEEKFASADQKARKNLKATPVTAVLMSEAPGFTLDQALDQGWLPWQPE